MELNFSFLPPFILMVAGALLVTITIINLKFKKQGLGYLLAVAAIGLYLAVGGLVLVFTDENLKLVRIQGMCLAFIPCMLLIYLTYKAICDQIKVNEKYQKKSAESAR